MHRSYRSALILLAVIFVAALAIRLSPVIQTPEKLKNGFGPYGDTYLYHVIAYNVYKGNGFSGSDNGQAFGFNARVAPAEYEPAIVRGPVYPSFMAMVYKILGNEKDTGSIQTWHKHWDKVRIAQCVLDALICILVFLMARAISMGSFVPALIAAGLYCFSFYNIFYTRALLSESVTTFLLTAALLLCVLGLKHGRLYLWGLAGAVFGLVILSRPEYLLFPAAFMLYMVIQDRSSIVNNAKRSFIFLIAAAIVVIPWTIRNYSIFKQFIPVNVGGAGASMFLATCETNDNWRGFIDLPRDAFDSEEKRTQAQALYTAFLKPISKGSIKAKELDHALGKLAQERISEHPFKCLKNWIMKIPRLWYQLYVPIFRDKEASGGFFIFYFIFAVCALWKGAKEERALMAPVCLLFVYLNLVLLPFHIEPRYGVPLMPGIICLASIGIWKIFLWFGRVGGFK